MRTMRTDHEDRAAGTPLLAKRHSSERCFASLIVSCTRHRDRRRHKPRDKCLVLQQTRAARGYTPGRLFGSWTGMSQMPNRDPNTKVTRRPGRRLHDCPAYSHLPSLLRVVPSVALLVKRAIEAAVEDTLGRQHDGTRASRGPRFLPHPRCLLTEHQPVDQGGAR